MFGWFKKEEKTNKEIAIEKFKKAGLTFEEADYFISRHFILVPT